MPETIVFAVIMLLILGSSVYQICQTKSLGKEYLITSLIIKAFALAPGLINVEYLHASIGAVIWLSGFELTLICVFKRMHV